MNLSKYFLLSVIAAAFCIGCSSLPKDARIVSQTEKTGIFSEITKNSPIPQGSADLVIKASLKTPSAGHNIFWTDDPHGKPDYPFQFNIDGQAMTWKVHGIKEDVPQDKREGILNQDCGTGMKYFLERRIRLAAGNHVLTFSLPVESFTKQMQINVISGKENILDLKPVYDRPFKRNEPNFQYGVKDYEAFLNGERLR